MALRVSTELPPSGVVALTEVFRAEAHGQPLRLVEVFDGQPPVDDRGRLVYDDPSGAATKVYQVIFYDAAMTVLRDTGHFTPNLVGGPDLGVFRRVDHDYGAPDALSYQTQSGVRVVGATVACFRAADYDAGRRDVAVAVTKTDANGRWAAPFYLPAGQDYVVVFSKSDQWGPDAQRITV